MGNVNIFSLEWQYQEYLKRIELDEVKMHPTQRIQLRDTFFAACVQMMLLLRNEISEHDEEEAVEILTRMLNEGIDFFLKEGDKLN